MIEFLDIFGAGDGIRIHDPNLGKVVALGSADGGSATYS
jgi:hypothetical protein